MSTKKEMNNKKMVSTRSQSASIIMRDRKKKEVLPIRKGGKRKERTHMMKIKIKKQKQPSRPLQAASESYRNLGGKNKKKQLSLRHTNYSVFRINEIIQ
jgi:hypothetical protein